SQTSSRDDTKWSVLTAPFAGAAAGPASKHAACSKKAAIVRPAKAGAFCGSQSHRGKSRSPVAWVAGSVGETGILKPTDDAIVRMAASHQAVAQPNERWPRNFQPRRPSRQWQGEGSMAHRDQTDAVRRSGGVVID